MLRVIGLGSPFGDDRVGMALVDALRQSDRLRSHLQTGLEFCCADRPGPALLSHLEEADKAIIIDAVVCGGPVGKLYSWSDVREVEQCKPVCSTHALGLAQTLAMGRQLGILPGRLRILGIEIDPDEKGTNLSDQIKSEFPALLNKIADEIVSFSNP